MATLIATGEHKVKTLLAFGKEFGPFGEDEMKAVALAYDQTVQMPIVGDLLYLHAPKKAANIIAKGLVSSVIARNAKVLASQE